MYRGLEAPDGLSDFVSDRRPRRQRDGGRKRLNRVQANVTTRIRQLADDLDAALFLRRRKGGFIWAGAGGRPGAMRSACWPWPMKPVLPCAIPNRGVCAWAQESTAAVRLTGAPSEYQRGTQGGAELRDRPSGFSGLAISPANWTRRGPRDRRRRSTRSWRSGER